MKKKWYRLDNTAKIFPSIISKRLTTVFRISAVMRDPVNEIRLQKALIKTIERYPYFRVTLKKGVFWSYLQESNNTPQVEQEREQPCRKMSKWFDRKFLFRVLVYKNRISVEFSHILTDGTGSLLFLKKLLNNYISSTTLSETISNTTLKEEEEDSYIRYYRRDIPPPRWGEVGAFHLPGPLLSSDSLRIITGTIPVSDIKNNAKEHNLTITEFLISCYLWTLQEFNKQNKRKRYLKPLRIMVPVNLRKIYPSNSIRNFFLSVFPGIDLRLGDYSFDEIAKTVHNYMQIEINEKYINQQISKNVSTEQNFFIKFIPLAIKYPIEKIIYNHYSNKKHSGVITNLGVITLSKKVEEAVESFRFIPNPNPVTKVNIGIVSFKDSLSITFGSLTKYRDVEKIFFRTLRNFDIPVTIETNE